MPPYRFYTLAPDGKIDAASNHECADDEAALAHARTLGRAKPIEGWLGTRKVFLLQADGTVKQSGG